MTGFINRGWRTYIWRQHVSCWSWMDVHWAQYAWWRCGQDQRITAGPQQQVSLPLDNQKCYAKAKNTQIQLYLATLLKPMSLIITLSFYLQKIIFTTVFIHSLQISQKQDGERTVKIDQRPSKFWTTGGNFFDYYYYCHYSTTAITTTTHHLLCV